VTPPSAQFDVFLSHNNLEKSEVERIAIRLKRAGIEPWLDTWCLTPGGDWQEELARGLRTSRACAVFVGPHGIGDWERLEFSLATARMAKERGFRAFLVLLPGLPEPFDTSTLPPFLGMRTWVDLRKGIFDERGFQLLIHAIAGLAPGPAVPIEARTDVCPYRGLQSFDEEHAAFFFGRDADTQRLIERLKSTRFLAVLGPSGSGKSSLVRAALIPALRQGAIAGSDTWDVSVFTPGARPLTALAANCVRLYPENSVGKLLDALTAEERALHLSVSLALADRPAAQRVVWVVDQFEEIFTLCNDEAERRRFLENLIYAARVPGGRSLVLLTMRADFYPSCAAYPELAALIAREQYLVSPMGMDGLRSVIEEPAWQVGLELEPGLTETILEDVESQPGALPLLEHALLELWRRRRGQLLTLEGYQESGGVEGAIAKRADTLYAAFSPEQQQISRRILLRLTQPGEGTGDTRRRASLDELVTDPDEEAQVQSVVQTMTDARLLTTHQANDSDDAGVEVSHEALIRGWPRLTRWIDENREGLLSHRRLGEAALAWRKRGEEEGVLYRGTPLGEAERWRAEHEAELNELEIQFLDASVSLRDREARARKEIQERELAQARALADEQRARADAERQRAEEGASNARKLRTRFFAAATFAVVAFVAAAGFVVAYRSANAERVRADNRRIMLESLTKIEQEPDVALLLGVEAFRRARDLATQSHLLRLLQNESMIDRFLYAQGGVMWAFAYDASGERLAAGNDRGMLTLWDVASGQPLGAEISTGLDDIDAIAFGPAEGRMVVAGGEGVLQLWDVGAPRLLRQTEPLDDYNATAFSSDGRRAAVASRFDISFWDTEAWRSLGSVGWEGDVSVVNGLSFSPDGERLATADHGRGLQLWDVRTAQPLGPRLRADEDEEFLGVAFSPEGRRIASSAVWIRLWDLDRREPIGLPLRGHQANVWRIAFSPGGDQLVSSGDDALQLWDLDARAPSGRVLRRKQSPTGSIAFSPDGRQLAAGEGEGKVILWKTHPEHHLAVTLEASQQTVNAVAYSPDGKRFAWGEDDGVLRLRDGPDDTSPARVIRIPDQAIFNLEFSPDGKQLAIIGMSEITLLDVASDSVIAQMRHGGTRPQHVPAALYSPVGDVLATGGMDGRIRLWNTSDGALVREIDAHPSTVLALAFSPDGLRLASGGGMGELHLWNLHDGAPAPLALDTAGPTIHAVQFLADGRQLLTVSDSAIVRWDARTGRPIGDALPIGNDGIASGAVAIDPRGARLALLLADGSVRLWDLQSGAPLPDPLRPVRFVYMTAFPAYGAIAFSPDASQLATAAVGSGVVLWNVDPASWVREACRIANRDLTRAEWDQYVSAKEPYQRTCAWER